MVCREIISCPIVQLLRGELELCRIAYCETGSLPCALHQLVREGKPVPPTMLPSGVARPGAALR
jgi:hypothetical protein